MLQKYLDQKKAVVDEPSVWKISDGSIQIQKAGESESFSFDDEFIIQFGDLRSYAPVETTPVQPSNTRPDQSGSDSGNSSTEEPDNGSGNNQGESGGDSGSSSGSGESQNESTTSSNTWSGTGIPYYTDDPSFNGIKITLYNKSSREVRFSNKFHMYVKNSRNSSNVYNDPVPFYFGSPSSTDGGYAHWHTNPNVLKVGQSKTFQFTQLVDYSNQNGTSVATSFNIPYGKSFVTADSTNIPAIKLGIARYSDSGSVTNSPYLYVYPINNAEAAVIKKGRTYNLIIYGQDERYSLIGEIYTKSY